MYRCIYIMCLNPLTIRNNRRFYRPLLHQMDLQVPCGHCEECVRQRRSDYAVRATFESVKYVGTPSSPKKGSVIMVLLTYSPASVPRISVGKYKDEMCFDREHIKTLLRMLSDIYNNSRNHRTFSCLIGAEYAVNPERTERPHYHCEFWLDESINPHAFMETIRRIWYYNTLDKSVSPLGKHRVTKWSFGSLGIVLPFEGDRQHDYIVRDVERASVYCAKYAVKQVGFYNKPFVKFILENNLKHKYLRYMPKVWTTQGFGKNILSDASYNRVTQKVRDPYSLVEICVPAAIKDMDEYDRVFRGRYSLVYNHLGEQVFNHDGTPRMRRLYDRERKPEYYDIRHKSLDYRIDKLTTAFISFGCHPSLSPLLAVYHYVYYRLPLGILSLIGDTLPSADIKDIATFCLTNKEFYHTVYDIAYLQPSEYIHVHNNVEQMKMRQLGQIYVESFDMILVDIPYLHDNYIRLRDIHNHETSNKLETQFQSAQKLRELISPHPC